VEDIGSFIEVVNDLIGKQLKGEKVGSRDSSGL